MKCGFIFPVLFEVETNLKNIILHTRKGAHGTVVG
jgi:hypothetical protein